MAWPKFARRRVWGFSPRVVRWEIGDLMTMCSRTCVATGYALIERVARGF